MNQMGHEFPNMVDEDPGWYQHPPGTVAVKASEADLARDRITLP